MFDINTIDRNIELFVFDIFVAIHKIKKVSIIYTDLPSFEKAIMELISNMESKLKQELIASFIEDNNYLDFIVKELKSLK